jgi:hypothetical protein
LVDAIYPRAQKVVLVMDNLKTHTPASLCGAFPPAEAKCIADKSETHSTPKHGSWLNTAEIDWEFQVANAWIAASARSRCSRMKSPRVSRTAMGPRQR